VESEYTIAEQSKNNFTVLWVSLICLAFCAFVFFQYISLDKRMKGIEETKEIELQLQKEIHAMQEERVKISRTLLAKDSIARFADSIGRIKYDSVAKFEGMLLKAQHRFLKKQGMVIE